MASSGLAMGFGIKQGGARQAGGGGEYAVESDLHAGMSQEIGAAYAASQQASPGGAETFPWHAVKIATLAMRK
jgi:hypothetical protein